MHPESEFRRWFQINDTLLDHSLHSCSALFGRLENEANGRKAKRIKKPIVQSRVEVVLLCVRVV
jgi:hypothetical protein